MPVQNPSRRAVLAGLATAGTAGLVRPRAARAASGNIRIGHLTDIADPYSTNSGPASIACAKQAIEDFNPASKGLTVEYMVADHQNSADVALNITREWLDRGDVDAILEVNNSAIALAMSNLTLQKDKAHLNSGAVSADLTGKACRPNMVHWTYDSWMLAHASSVALTRSGLKTWYAKTAEKSIQPTCSRPRSPARANTPVTISACSSPSPPKNRSDIRTRAATRS